MVRVGLTTTWTWKDKNEESLLILDHSLSVMRGDFWNVILSLWAQWRCWQGRLT